MMGIDLKPLTLQEATGTHRFAEIDELTRAQMLDYRVHGYSYTQIGAMVGMHPTAARDQIKRAMKELAEFSAETAEQIRQTELQRFDLMTVKAMKIMDESEDASDCMAAMNCLMRLAAMRFDLFGLREQSSPTGMPITRDAVIEGIRKGLADIVSRRKDVTLSPQMEKFINAGPRAA